MLPKGIILLWYGAIVDIPAGFVICDGNNDTPDLRDKFIIGAGSTYNPGATGGANTHNHTFIGDGHTHDLPIAGPVGGGANYSWTTDMFYTTGTTQPGSSLPPYHALAYIMKT